MPDPRFFPVPKALTLADIAALTEASCAPDQSARQMRGLAPLPLATPEDVSFVATALALGAPTTQAGAVFILPKLVHLLPPGCVPLITATPQMAYVRLARHLYPGSEPQPGIDPTARIAPDAKIGKGVEIGAFAVIGAGAEIGDGCQIGQSAVVGPGVVIGPGGRIGPLASITHALIGAGVTIHAGARIGTAGFGLMAGPDGLTAIPQLGRVLIGDAVEIGANSTIDRGAGEDTVIGRGTKIDNLVMVGHNCRIGSNCVLIGQVGLAGSVTLEDGVILAGQVGVADHLTIGSGARVAAKSGVSKSIPAGAIMAGIPARDAMTFRREIAALKNLRRTLKRLMPGHAALPEE